MISFVFAGTTTLQWNSQPNSLYNLGDIVNTSATLSGTNLSTYFVCNNIPNPLPFYFSSSIPGILTNLTIPIDFELTPNFASPVGTCQIEAVLDGINFYTSSFQVSNIINVTITSSEKEFKPGNQITISGNAIKENGQNVNGIAYVNISYGNTSIYQTSSSVANGNFYFNFTLLSNAIAGQYLVNIISYELDSSSAQTNAGSANFQILIDQVPTTLNLVPLNDVQSIMPGQTYNIQAILYDQTGQEINAPVNFTIKNSKGEVMNQEMINTDQVLDIPISYNDAPNTWTIYATSDGLNTQSTFEVLENAAVSVDLINKTLLVTNQGNVPYNNSIQVRLGNQSVPFNVSLGVGQNQKYVLTAPDGNYSIQVLSTDGNNLYNGEVSLTGNAVNVQEASKGVIGFIQYPWFWIVVLVILVFVIFFFFTRSHKRRFLKKINLNRQFRLRDGIVTSEGRDISSKDRMVKSRNIAEFSSSIQGEKQGSSIVCVNIKNFEEIRSGKGGVNETMNRLKSVAEDLKAVIYENGNYFFFIFAPVVTKSLNNDLSAIEAAEEIKTILTDHNRLLKQKIVFGISVNYGMIIAKHGMNGLKFMSLGNFISLSKKLTSISKGEILLTKEIRNRVATDVKTEMQSKDGLEFYPLLQVRNREKSQKFIKEFMSKIEKEEQDSNKKFFS
jgi:hypothetical protein